MFVVCSKRENFPTTCIEAQCCGTPVVGFDTGGTKETSLLSEEDFVPYGDLEGLKEKVIEKLNNSHPDLAERAQNEYSSGTMARRYMEEYDKKRKKERVLLINVKGKNTSEFHHKNKKSIYNNPEDVVNPDMGINVNKETHKEIHKRGIVDEKQLEEQKESIKETLKRKKEGNIHHQ